MQNNYYFLRQLSQHIAPLLTESVLVACFTQSKSELILAFSSARGADLYIKGTFQPDFTCLYFPEQFQRARRNSTDLFQEIIGKAVTGLIQYNHDRSFSIIFEDGYHLLFKMHGNRANVVLFQHEQVISLFKNKLAKDWQLVPDQLHRYPVCTFEAFSAAGGDPRKVLPALGTEALSYLQEKGWEVQSLDEKWQMLKALEAQLLNPQSFWVCELENKPNLLLFQQGTPLFESADPVAALAHFYRAYTHDWALRKETAEMLQQLDRQIRSTESYQYKLLQKLEELQTNASHRHQADLIMANLHNIPAKATSAELLDFYSGQPITVKLKRELSAQKNAEQYYRKAKNQQLEIQHLEDNLAAKEERLKELLSLREEVLKTEDLKKLRTLRKQQLPDDDQQPSLPYRLNEFRGYQLMVGKGASQNDEMLRHHSRKDDLWLHAKDVSGSHVIIRRQAGKVVPAPVKEKAAQLAAWYSKRKSDTLCPVICTARKWVRKVKGAPAGSVMVDKEEEVLLVEPKPFDKQ